MKKYLNINLQKLKKTRTFGWVVISLLTFTFALTNNANAQTLISPTGDGGFETGATFALNNWIAVNDANSKWYVGTFAKTAGSRGVYIDVNGTAGTGNSYNSGQIRTSHFYRDVAIPAGATNINLSFKWKANGESGLGADEWDFLRLYLVSTSVTPVAATLLPAGNIIGTSKYYLQSAAFQTANIVLSNALAGTTQRLVFTWRNDDLITNNPGAAVDEISLTYTAGGVCTGTPTPGNTISTANPVCSGVNFTLSLQNSTAGTGVTYQWQSSTDNITYANIGGATSAIYSTSTTVSRYYRCAVTCAGNTGTSNFLLVNITPSYNCVCTPSYTDVCDDDYISNVTFAGINNSTGCTGTTPSNLTTYASPNPSITGGASYPISVTTDGDEEGINVWIDYNMDGVFQASESVLSGFIPAVPQTYSGTVNVPLTVLSGQTKMRVRCRWNSTVGNACNNFDYGETEDYLITLVAAPPCITPPVSGSISGASPICASVSTVYNLSGGSGNIQWQESSTLSTGPFSDISGQNASTLNYNQAANGTYYLRVKHSVLGCVDAFSNVLTVVVNPNTVVSAQASAASVCPGGIVNLTSTAVAAFSNITDYPIPDNGNVSSPITISGFSPATIGTTTIKSVNFNINHTYVSDLRIRLFSPSGNAIHLVDGAGGAGVNFVNTTIVNSGAPNGNIAAGTAPFTGTYNTQVSFSGLTGATNGVWALRAIDMLGGDVGTILDWTLTLESNGVTYTWSSTPSGFTANSQNTSDIPTQNTTYQVQASLNGCNSTSSVAVSVSPIPVPSASSNAPVCEGQTLSLFGNNSASGQGTGNSYSWSGPNGFNDIVQNPTVNGATSASNGTYTVTVTNQFGCTATQNTLVSINPNPVLNILSQTNVECNGGSTGEFTIEVTNGSGFYLFDENGNINFDGMFTGYSAGNYIIQVTDGNSCEASIPVNITEADPTTTSDAGVDQSACTGTTATLAANNALVGTGSWSLVSGSGTFTSATNPATTVTGIGNGINTYRWTIDNALCSNSNFDDVNVTGTDLPTATLTGTQEICLGGSANLTITFTGTSPWLYSINGGAPVSTSTNLETVSVTPSSTTIYTITSLSDASCTGSATGSATVTVSTAPPASSCTITTLPVDACVGSTVVVSTNVVPGATSYTWSAPSGTLIEGMPSPHTTASNSVNITLGPLAANSSSWLICAFASNACGSTNTNCKPIRGSLSMPSAIVGSTVACPSTGPSNYTTTSVSGASSYLWTITGDASVSGTGLTGAVTFGPTFTTGSLCVRALLPCGYQGPTRCMTILNGTPTLGAMVGTFTVCPGTNGVAYSVPPSAGATTYNWTLPTGATVATGAGTNSITVNFGPTYTNGNVCVIATSVCGINSLPRCKTVASITPGTPGNFTTGATTGVCGQTITYNVNTVAGATGYTWTAPAGASLASANGTNTIDIAFSNAFTSGNVCVTADNACGSGNARCVIVKSTPANPNTISGLNSVCANDAGIGYSIAPVFGATGYVWTVPSGASIVSGQGTTSIIVDWGTNGGTIGVTASGTCGASGTRTLNVMMSCKIAGADFPGTTVNVYPNPVSNILNVDVISSNSEMYTIELIDLSGRVIHTNVINTMVGMNINQFDISNYAKGMYMLSVKNSEGFAKQIRVAVE